MDLTAESGFRSVKTEFSSYVIQYASCLSPLLTQGQAEFLKILLSSTLKTDSEFVFIQIFYHARCSIAHNHLIAEICLQKCLYAMHHGKCSPSKNDRMCGTIGSFRATCESPAPRKLK